MNLKWKLGVLFLLSALVMLWPASAKQNSAAQEAKPDYKNNNCVSCHSGLLDPLRLGNRYLEWQFSRHRDKGVSCEKCHGGDPSAKDKQMAHAGVSPASDQQGRLHWKNQPETCGACHQNVASAFVESAHYKQLSGIGLGPSCNTCHAHMAKQAPYSPVETAKLCSRCHDSINSLKPSPEIPARAKETMMALQRADYVIRWARLLLDNGRRMNLSLNEETNEFKTTEDTLRDARVKWHTFDLDAVRKQADGAFLKGVKVRDGLRKRLGGE
jgi:Cytochrome c7 and related cytochrome c/Cytochrome c554 and c-prime